MIVFQALINMAVSVNLIPVTGQPMPLISMGGTSTLFTSIAIGMILGVSSSVYTPEVLKTSSSSKSTGANVYAKA
jgi:cell division protein FtsW